MMIVVGEATPYVYVGKCQRCGHNIQASGTETMNASGRYWIICPVCLQPVDLEQKTSVSTPKAG